MGLPSYEDTLFYIVGAAAGWLHQHKTGASLTVEQATRIARQLANDKAAALYHWQPFLGSQPARLVANQWVWTEHQGFGYGDIQADVELAPDGTAKKVEIQILDSRNILP
jgi:hypothetical protein